MEEKMLTDEKCWNCIYIFLEKLWALDPKKYAAHGIGLGAFLSFCTCHWYNDLNWRRTWVSVFKKPWTNGDISSKNILPLTAALLLHYQNKYGFDLFAFTKIVHEMASVPALHAVELQVLQQALLEADGGSSRQAIHDYRFSDWVNYG